MTLTVFTYLGGLGTREKEGEREKKRGRTTARNSERACKTFFNNTLLV